MARFVDMSVEEKRAYWRAQHKRLYTRAVEDRIRANDQVSKSRRNAFTRAVQKGLVKSMPCIICGDECTVGHHASYDEQDMLNVTWLCRFHHAQVHAEHRAYENARGRRT